MVDLEAYFDRIGIARRATDDLRADEALLRELTLAHTQSIPFENLNALLRVPVPLDLDSLERKLVRSARGGYCFEQNAYFAAVLERLGYSVRRLAARVVWGGSAAQPWQNPRTHMALIVECSGQRFLCDVGFGGVTPTAPLQFTMNAEQETPHESFRILEQAELRLLQVWLGSKWLDVYVFDLQQQSAIDYEMANHYVAEHPASNFRFTLMAARAFDGGRYHLRNRLFTTFRPGAEKQQRELRDADEQIAVLQEAFGIELPETSRVRAALGNIREE